MDKVKGKPWVRDDEAPVDDGVALAVIEYRSNLAAFIEAYGVNPGVAEVGLSFSYLTGDQHMVYVSKTNGAFTLLNEDQLAEWEMRGLHLRGLDLGEPGIGEPDLSGPDLERGDSGKMKTDGVEGEEKDLPTCPPSWYVTAAKRLIEQHGFEHEKETIICTCRRSDLAERLEDINTLLVQLEGVLIAALRGNRKSH